MSSELTDDQKREALAQQRQEQAIQTMQRQAALKTALLQPGVREYLTGGYLADLAEEYRQHLLSDKLPITDALGLAVAVQRYRDACALRADLEQIAAAPSPALPKPPDAE